MDTAQIRAQALQMAIQTRQQQAAASGIGESDAATVARAQTFFAFLSADAAPVASAVTTAADVNRAAAAAGSDAPPE